MNPVSTLQQPSTTLAARGEPNPSPELAPRDTPLSRAQEARGYQSAYFLLRDLSAMKAYQISLEGWQLLMRVKDYCGWRYNEIVFRGTEFAPKPWRSR